MDDTWVGFIVVVLTIIGSHAMLHRDIAMLRERISKLEGVVEGFIAGQQKGA